MITFFYILLAVCISPIIHLASPSPPPLKKMRKHCLRNTAALNLARVEGKQGEFSSLCPFNFSTLNLINFYNLFSYQSLLCAVNHHNAMKNCANLIVGFLL